MTTRDSRVEHERRGQLDARPCFEHYPKGSGFDPKTGVFGCEICIPVAPL